MGTIWLLTTYAYTYKITIIEMSNISVIPQKFLHVSHHPLPQAPICFLSLLTKKLRHFLEFL